MNTIQNLFQQAQLAEAAYANFAGINASSSAQTIQDVLTNPNKKQPKVPESISFSN